jgi:predicted metallo-beta-lactamase superfamily hydrolase
MSDVKLIYLRYGEQIVGDVTYDLNGETITVNNPLSVVHMPEQKLGFIPYLQLTQEKDAVFKMSDIRHTFDPNQDIVNHWNSLFGSGIITPPDKEIIS